MILAILAIIDAVRAAGIFYLALHALRTMRGSP
jgi:hypothetical protein